MCKVANHMIVYIDIEHGRLKDEPQKWREHLQQMLTIKYNLELASREACLIVRYEKVTPALLREVGAKAVVVSGNATEFEHYDEADLVGLRTILREGLRPTIGFCGGAMLIAETFGTYSAPIDDAPPSATREQVWRERTHERGFMSVHKVAPHQLFDGLEDEMVFMQAHYWEIKAVPKGFDRFAESDVTPIQFIAGRTRPIFATQFHPEQFDDDHPDGRIFLENFFRLIA